MNVSGYGSYEGDAYPIHLSDIAREGPVNIMARRLLQHLQELMCRVDNAIIVMQSLTNPQQNPRSHLGIDQRPVKVPGMRDAQIVNKRPQFVVRRALEHPAGKTHRAGERVRGFFASQSALMLKEDFVEIRMVGNKRQGTQELHRFLHDLIRRRRVAHHCGRYARHSGYESGDSHARIHKALVA